MKLIEEYIRELILNEEGILGKYVWPTAAKGLELIDEPDTEIEKKLYQQLHKHFGTSSYMIKGTPPLDSESVEAIKQIISAGDYPVTFRRVEGSQALRGMRVTYKWLKKNAPQALEQLPEDIVGNRSAYEWNEPVPASFTYRSRGKYGQVSSWTNNYKVARSFTTQFNTDTLPIILYADTSSGFFIDSWGFSNYKGGIYKDELGIKKLNPQGRGEREIILLGDCRVVAVQINGTKKTHGAGIAGYI